jgi:phage N-6-adenine-methyltransferase
MAKMPKQKPGRSKQDYATPPEFIAAVEGLLGIVSFAHDFAADRLNSKGHTYWDEAVNSLSINRQGWADVLGRGWGWLNPPFANISPWAQRCAQLAEDGGKVALLVPAAVGANWFQDYVHGKARVYALNGRISFDGKNPYPKDCILALYGDEPGFYVWSWRGR